jgi:hypothetical protein
MSIPDFQHFCLDGGAKSAGILCKCAAGCYADAHTV